MRASAEETDQAENTCRAAAIASSRAWGGEQKISEFIG
jgi:hypothetical protein